VLLMTLLTLAAIGNVQPVLARWLPIRLALAFYYLNLFSAQALVAYARNRGTGPW
jgi:hypothetical protein